MTGILTNTPLRGVTSSFPADFSVVAPKVGRDLQPPALRRRRRFFGMRLTTRVLRIGRPSRGGDEPFKRGGPPKGSLAGAKPVQSSRLCEYYHVVYLKVGRLGRSVGLAASAESPCPRAETKAPNPNPNVAARRTST